MRTISSTTSRYLLGALFLVPTAGPVHAQFGSYSAYSTGQYAIPSDVAVGDVNGDGWLDVVAAHATPATVGVLLGQAGGGFATLATYASNAFTGSQKVVLGDVNRDGRLDIVTSSRDNDEVGVLIGQAGGFAAVVNYPTGRATSPADVALGDVNSDGWPDIVTVNTGSVGVLLGQVGGFASVIPYAISPGLGPRALALGDMNGDGQLDIVTVNSYAQSIGVLLGQAGRFAAETLYPVGTGNSPGGVALGDVNKDGHLDIVTAVQNGSTSQAVVLLGQASGGFSPRVTSGPYYISFNRVALGDTNGDGWLDLVATATPSHAVGVMLGQAAGIFAAPTFYSVGALSGPVAVALSDLNRDGRPDIVTANLFATGGSVGVLLNSTPLASAVEWSAARLQLWPNPATGQVQLLSRGGGTATLFDAQGRVVASQLLPQSSVPTTSAFSLTHITPGLYLMLVQPAVGAPLRQSLWVE